MGSTNRLFLVLSFLALVVASHAGCRRGSSGSSGAPGFGPTDVSVSLGIGRASDLDGWDLLRCVVHNTGESFSGTLRVHGIVRDSESRAVLEKTGFETEAEIPAGARRAIALPVRAESWEAVSLEFVSAGGSVRVRHDFRTRDPAYVRVLVVSDQDRNYSTFAKVIDRFLEAARGPREAGGPPAASFDTIRAANLPLHPAAYDPFHIVVLWDEVLANPEPAAAEVLESWVRRGGTLVAVPGPSWGAQLPQRLKTLLSITVGDRAATPTPTIEAALRRARVPTLYRDLQPTGSARWNEEETAVNARLGLGRTTALTVAPSGATLPDDSAMPIFYSAFRVPIARALCFSGNTQSALAAIERNIPGTLAGMIEFEIPSASEVFFAMLLYVFVGIVFPGLFFRVRRRSERTYVVVVVVALLSVSGIAFLGLLSSLPGSELKELSVVRLAPGERVAQATSFLCAVSPRFSGFDPEPDTRESLLASARVQPLRGENWGVDQDRFGYGYEPREAPVLETTYSTTRVGGTGLRLPTARLFPNGPIFFRADYSTDSERSTVVGYRPQDPATDVSEQLTVENRGTRPLIAMVVWGNQFASLGTIGGNSQRRWSGTNLGIGAQEWSAVSRSLYGDFGEVLPFSYAQSRGIAVRHAEMFNLVVTFIQGSDDERRASGRPAPGISRTPRNATDVIPLSPRHVILWSSEAFFPDRNGFQLRDAQTAYVIELPPPSE